MNRLIVYFDQERVGELVQNDDGLLRFTYAPTWLAKKGAIPLSRMLTLAPETYENKKARPFFAGILPEEGPRTRIAEILGISERNDFALLERIGGECAGALSLLPEGMSPLEVESRVRPLSENELSAVINELPRRPLLAGEEGLRLSLAGAQDKLPIVVDGDAISLPLGNTPSTHIIKPEPERFPGLVANEVFCMGLARALGLRVPEVTIRMVGEKPCIVVARYDRARNAESHAVTRLHQEDLCQALGRPPERKYQQEGGPLVRECIGLLREWSTTPVLDILAFVDALIFNLLIGNADAHGKNFSMIYNAGTRRLAPFYDLVSTIAWPGLSTRLAMSIGHGKNVNDLNPEHFRRMTEEAELGWPMVRERIEILSGRGIEELERGTLAETSSEPEVSREVAKSILERCRRMLDLTRAHKKTKPPATGRP